MNKNQILALKRRVLDYIPIAYSLGVSPHVAYAKPELDKKPKIQPLFWSTAHALYPLELASTICAEVLYSYCTYHKGVQSLLREFGVGQAITQNRS